MNGYFLIFFVFATLYLLVIWKADKAYPILYLFAFTYFLQYIFSTYLIYNVYTNIGIRMALKQEVYFDYAIPALLSLFAGVFLFNKNIDVSGALKRIDPQQANRLGYLLLVISYFFDLLPVAGITLFSSVATFTGYLKYVAAFCFLFTRSKINYFLCGLIYVNLIAIVLRGGVFMDFINWATYLFFFLALKLQLSFSLRASFILLAAPLLILIQSVKEDYRKVAWKNQDQAGLDLFTDIAKKQKEEEADGSFAQKKGVVNTIARLNEGWHLAVTMKHVPRKEPFANGDEMMSDVVSSILPRVLVSNKKVVHSKEKFQQYTGLRLTGGTSMTIGLLGDFYINFGRTGSFVMLFVFGALVALLLRIFIRRYVLSDPINIIWIPFMLSYLIRADNDFYIFLNCLTKGFLIFLAVNYIRHQWLGATKTKLVRS